MTTQVLNHDIVGLYNRLTRFQEEVIKSVSSGISDFNAFDQKRIISYLDAIDTYHNWVLSQPQLDLPESHPKVYDLEAPTIELNVENESINDIVNLMSVAIEELINSQSARQGSGLITFDSDRLAKISGKIRTFMTDYVATIVPLDLPDSTPEEPLSGPGKKGI